MTLAAGRRDRERAARRGGDWPSVGDYNRKEATLHIRETKFYKSRLLPINAQIADEVERYLRARTRKRLPIQPDTPLIWNATRGGRAYTGTGLLYCLRPLLRECGIRTLKGQPPRIHDLRHRADSPVMPTSLRLVPYSPLFCAELRVCWLVEVGIIRVVFSVL